MLKNSFLDDASKKTPGGSDKEPQEPLLLNEKKEKNVPLGENYFDKNFPLFRFVPSINLSLEDIFAPVMHPANSRKNSGGRSSSLSAFHNLMQTSVSKSSSLSSCQSLKKMGKKRRKKYSVSAPYVQSDSEGEDNLKYSRLGKALVKFTMNPNDFDYFTRVVYSDDERQPDPLSGESISSKDSVLLSESFPYLSLVELLQCIISIQIQLAMYEAEQKHLSSPLLATHDLLQFSLDTFTSMVSELKQKRENFPDLQLLLTWMLKLVFSSVQRFMKSGETLHSINEFRIIPKLLKLVCTLLDLKFYSDGNHAVQSECIEMNKDFESNLHDAGKEDLALDIIIGLLFLLQSCTCLNLERSQVLEGLHLHIAFLQHNGADIIRKIVLQSKSLSLNKRAEILDSISHLVLYMKYWKEDIFHAERCEKKSHRFCEYQAVQNHHSRVFGITAYNIKTIHPGRCMISNFCDVLLDCFAGSKETELSVFAIKALSRCGLCCCMCSKLVLSKLLEDLQKRSIHVVSFVTLFIENIVWRDMGGLAVTDLFKCCFCQKLKLDSGSHLSNDYTSDESLISKFVTKGKRPNHQFHGHKEEETDGNTLPAVFWEGLAVYETLLSRTEITSKVINHIVRLVCQSNADIKLAMCEHLIIPMLRKICGDGVAKYITREGNKKEILVSLIKCLRLTLMGSDDVKLFKFINTYGPGLIAECKEIQGLRHETFLLLCNIIKKELKLKPNVLVMGEVDELNDTVFFKLFEWEVIEHDEFWSAYFGMKAEEVRQKFFIRTHQSMNIGEKHNYAIGCDNNTPKYDSEKVVPEDATDNCNSECNPTENITNIQGNNTLTDSIELGVSVIGHLEEAKKESPQSPCERKVENAEYEDGTRDSLSTSNVEKYYEDADHLDRVAISKKQDNQLSDVFKAESCDVEVNAESVNYKPVAEHLTGSEVLGKESGWQEPEESVTLQGPASKNAGSELFPSDYTDQATEVTSYSHSTRHSTPRKNYKAAEGSEKLEHQAPLYTESPIIAEHPEEGCKVC